MAYSGSTAASSLQNPPRCLAGAFVGSRAGGSTVLLGVGSTAVDVGTQGGKLWAYVSTDAVATVLTTGYFSDGDKLGMRPGDILFGVTHTTDGATLVNYFGSVTSVSSNGATVQVGGQATT